MVWLRHATGVSCWVTCERADALIAATAHRPEVAVIELGSNRPDGLAVAVQVAAAAPHVQAVFFAHLGGEAEMAAARSLGLERVFLVDELPEALGPLLFPLAELVRLRRRVERVEDLVRSFSTGSRAGPACGRIPLSEGERRYREAYVRTVLAETGNRREAARRAGVPYTTLCDMMRKLGINGDGAELTKHRNVG